MTETLSAENRARLAQVSTATLSTVLFKRGLKNMFVQDVRPVGTQKENMVGENGLPLTPAPRSPLPAFFVDGLCGFL